MRRLRNFVRLRRTQGCLTDCIAFYFNIHPESVPYFVYPRKGWMRKVKAFFRRRGLRVRWVSCSMVPRRGTHIVCGDSLVLKTHAHAVVYRNGRLIYDPQYPSKWNDKRITHRLKVDRGHPTQ